MIGFALLAVARVLEQSIFIIFMLFQNLFRLVEVRMEVKLYTCHHFFCDEEFLVSTIEMIPLSISILNDIPSPEAVSHIS